MITITHDTTAEELRAFDLEGITEQDIGNKVRAYMDAIVDSRLRNVKAKIVRDVPLTEIETKLGERE